MSEERRGVDAEPDLAQHRKGNVDPQGNVSSGIQTGPLRGADEAPVASTDEAMRGDRPGGSPGRMGARPADAENDITDKYLPREDEA